MTHYIYLVRHGEHQDAEHGLADGPLSARGRRQAELIADRLSGLPLDAVWHSPLLRANETARAIAERIPAVEMQASALLFDCVPTGMTEETPAAFEPFFGAVTEAEIEAAAKAAHAHGFITRLPQGYDTPLTDTSAGLSAGQRQLLCIARLMLALPPMLILDEATSSIDTRTELKIQQAFAAMMRGRTSFIVAHRLSTIREADVILVMQNGHIIEQGKHDELLKQNGFYAKLYNSQFAP